MKCHIEYIILRYEKIFADVIMLKLYCYKITGFQILDKIYVEQRSIKENILYAVNSVFNFPL